MGILFEKNAANIPRKKAKVPIVKTLAFTAIFNYSHSLLEP